MRARMYPLTLLVVAVLYCGNALSQAVGSSNVTVTPFNTRPVVVFDPTRPNGALADANNPLPGPPVDADGVPQVAAGEDAVTVCAVEVTTGNGNMLTVTATATIYMPVGGGSVLLGHERAHAFLCRREYDENAESKLVLATQPAMTVGTTLDEAVTRGLQAIRDQMEVISTKFDQLTDHGTSQTVNTARAVRELLRERDLARRQSVYQVPPGLPNPLRVWGGTADPPWLQFDPLTNRVRLGGDVLITDTNDMTDPIIGRGAFELDPMTLIGRDSNGVIHLADTGFRIRDIQTGLLLLNGYLLDVGYLDSPVAGYQGMLQASLDVPPDWATGTSNPFGSQFIAGLADGSAAGEPATFWFYTEQRLFEPGGGGGLIGRIGPAIGNMKAGFMLVTNVPEPSSAYLLLAALLAWGSPWVRKRQRPVPRIESL